MVVEFPVLLHPPTEELTVSITRVHCCVAKTTVSGTTAARRG